MELSLLKGLLSSVRIAWSSVPSDFTARSEHEMPEPEKYSVHI